MSKNSLFSKPTIYLVMAIYIAFTFFVLAMGNDVIAATVPEDHYFEIAGSLALFAASFLFLYGFRVARRSRPKTWSTVIKQLVYLALALLFFFGAGEEISWGQRLVGFETPEAVVEVNQQEEFNAHNLAVWQNTKLLDANTLFDAFWFLFAVLIPAVAFVIPSFRRFAGQFIPIVHWGIGGLFLYNYMWAKLAKITFDLTYTFDRISFVQAVQEIKESNYAIIFILVALDALWDLDRSSHESRLSVQSGSINIEPAFRD
jgi:hypothetical protein